ncbi:MAG: DNA polymerase III subunit gamma/tau [Nitriliruptor sp.]
MAYVSLYRRYRPATFGDIVGQKHVIQTLVHALEEDRLHHAYLFTGPRGTGKTSTARILAKAINCEAGPTPDPCGTCGQCTAIADGSSVDVIELDMASHGGVDDARDLRDRALFAPASARRKVYILDEVHMASTAAFNALLKLIEEPPGHVLFAMATTDPQKVLPTILSRVQRLDLRRVAADEVGEHVRRVCEQEDYAIEDGAVEAVVRAGDGSVRDTLSVLEQVLAYSGAETDQAHGGEVTALSVAAVLGNTPLERVVDAVDLLGARDLAGLLGLVQTLSDDGHDLRRFTLDLVQHLRDLLVLQVAPDRPDLVDATDDRRRRLQAQTAALPQEALLRAVATFADTLAEQRQGSPRLPLELALATLATPGADGDVVELADRVSRLEAGGHVAPRRAVPAAAAPESPDLAPTSQARETAPPGDARAAARAAAAAAATAPAEPVPAEPAPDEPTGGATAAGAPAADVPAADAPAADVPTADAPATDAPATDAPGADVPTADVSAAADAPPPVPDAAGEADPDALVLGRWDAILDLVKDRSRRHHAVFEPATPLRVRNRILTLRYPQRYASFHAVNATKGEFSESLGEAVERSTGLKVRVDVVIEGDDDRRRPQPPTLTPSDARSSAVDDDPPADEVAAVREAEQVTPSAPDAAVTDALLAEELGAELLEHRPAPEA